VSVCEHVSTTFSAAVAVAKDKGEEVMEE